MKKCQEVSFQVLFCFALGLGHEEDFSTKVSLHCPLRLSGSKWAHMVSAPPASSLPVQPHFKGASSGPHGTLYCLAWPVSQASRELCTPWQHTKACIPLVSELTENKQNCGAAVYACHSERRKGTGHD